MIWLRQIQKHTVRCVKKEGRLLTDNAYSPNSLHAKSIQHAIGIAPRVRPSKPSSG